MSGLRNIDLKTVTKVVVVATGENIGDIVAAGQKRWVTFISVASGKTGAYAALLSKTGAYFASCATGAKASCILSANRKLVVFLRSSKMSGRSGPVTLQGSLNTPLFSIAAGKYLSVAATNTTAYVTVSYFDE